MSSERLYLLSVGSQRLLVSAAAVANVRRIRNAGAELAALHTERGRISLYDLAAWLKTAPPERRIALVIELDGAWVGVLADALEDTVELDGPLEPLPALLQQVTCDPAVLAMALVAGVPRLMIDLAQVVRSQRASAGGALAQGV